MIPFGLQVIFILVVVSGLISYVGDRIGRSIGRKRLTLFGLRPRYTAIAITIISGVIIAMLTFLSIIVISKDARTALFGLDKLRQEIKEKKADLSEAKKQLNEAEGELAKARSNIEKKSEELDNLQDQYMTAKEEISILESMRKSLNAEIDRAKSGSLLYEKNQVIVVTLVESGSKSEVEGSLDKIIASLNGYVQRFSAGDTKDRVKTSNYDYAASYMVSHKGRLILKAIVDKNVVLGEDVPVHFEILPNEKIFSDGEVIASLDFNETKREAIEENLKNLLTQAHQQAKKKGIVPDITGSVGSIPYSDIFETSKKISLMRKKVKAQVVAKRDIYAIGPLNIEFRVQ